MEPQSQETDEEVIDAVDKLKVYQNVLPCLKKRKRRRKRRKDEDEEEEEKEENKR